MEGERLGEKYAYLFKDLAAFARAENKIDETNIYQEANQKILPIVDKMLEENMLPGSKMEGMEHVKDFLDQIAAGKHGLLLCEHYSNFDLPGLHYLLRQAGEEGKILAAIIDLLGDITEEICDSKQSLSKLAEDLTLYPQHTINVRVKDKGAVENDKDVISAIKDIEKLIGGKGRVLLRKSGTEPVVRVMVESEENCEGYVDRLVNFIIERGHSVD